MNIAANILGEQDAAMALHPHVLTSPDRAAVVEENLHFISNRTMVTSAHMRATDKMGSTPQASLVQRINSNRLFPCGNKLDRTSSGRKAVEPDTV